MKTTRIVHIPPFSWKKRLTTFAAIFGLIWLFIDPLTSLTTASVLFPSIGGWRYAGLVVITLLLTASTEYMNKARMVSKISFINLTMILAEEGKRISVEVSQDMLIGTFISLFLEKASKEAASGTAVSRHDMYIWHLSVNRNGQYVEMSSSNTIEEAGLVSGDTCKLHGHIKPRRAFVAAFRGLR